MKQTYTLGIKLPWTLNDEENWNHTHRMAGWLWMIGGVLFMLLIFVEDMDIWLMIVLMSVMAIVPIIYSFVYYIKHKE